MAGRKKTPKKSTKDLTRRTEVQPVRVDSIHLLADLQSLIRDTREQLARVVNSALVLLYWSIGDRIRRDILKETRADYGKEIVSTLAVQLTAEFGRGYSRRNLFHMIRLADVYPRLNIVQTLSAQLGWSHFLEVIYFDDELKRDFYAEMCPRSNPPHCIQPQSGG
ncbi:MAG TPA: DUF1016 N-terminal domain-containing protein [Gemmata sp.]|jgi:hypothetical protein|nr:DUF1016 N-terminal domain-containing protein [Gemmata sp.]